MRVSLLAAFCLLASFAVQAGPEGPALHAALLASREAARGESAGSRPGPIGPGFSEVRALWVQRGSLTSAPAIISLINTAKAAGFNTLLVQVRGRGDAYYVSRIEPRGSALGTQDPSFDPLELAVAAGHRAGLRIHAWVNVSLVADAELPAARNHIARTHPEWLMVPRDLAAEAQRLDPRSAEYAGMLTHFARANREQIEGLYLSPIQPAAAAYTVSVIADIAARYAVDGIHVDYARFPSDGFDYSPGALSQFRQELLPHLTGDERREYNARAEGRPIFYTQMFPQRWEEFRQARMTALVTQIRAAVTRERPGAWLTAAVWPDPEEAATHRLQDWRGWLDAGLLDAICPMAYTEDAAVFRQQIAGVKQVAGRRPVWAGIGAYRLSATETITNIQAARRLGAEGISLFSYDNLVPHANADPRYLSKVADGAFAR